VALAQELPGDDVILVHPNHYRGPITTSVESIRARYADGSLSGGEAFQGAMQRALPAAGTLVIRSCDADWRVGMEVVAAVDHPSGIPCVVTGDRGIIVSGASTGEILVQWQGKDCGHDGNGNGVAPQTPNSGQGRWFVDCDEITPPSDALVPALLTFAPLQHYERPLSYYDGGFGWYGTGPGPNYGVTFGVDTPCYQYYNGSNNPTPGVIALVAGDNSMLINFRYPIQALSYYFSSSVFVTLKAYSGPNGTGQIVGQSSFNANTSGPFGNYYNTWTLRNWTWSADARSIVLDGMGDRWGLDNLLFDFTPCPGGDCNGNDICDATELPGNDCNGNGTLDACDIASGSAQDCNGNGRPDSCDIQTGAALDCNGNGRPDSCDIATGSSADVNGNGIPDGCEPDCNGNGIPDAYEVVIGASPDCNLNGLPDSCDIATGAVDCDSDGVPDSCELAAGSGADCNANGRLDNCDIAVGAAGDCNGNGVPDSCDIARGASVDCNGNSIPDTCDLVSGAALDCNGNGTPDSCDLAGGAPDCNGNAIPDSCDIASGFDPDPEGDGIPNSCEPTSAIRMPGPVEGGATCLEIADELAFDVFVDNPPVTVVAGQFSLSYDASVLEFIDVLGGEEPFTYVPLHVNNAANGTLLFIASVQEGGAGTLADSRVARVRFRAVANDCDGSTQVAFNPAAAPILIADGGGNTAGLPLVEPSPVRIVTGAPVLSGVPSDLDVPADAGAGCFALRTLNPPQATSSCGAVTLEWTRTDGQPLGAPWPCGTTVVTWTATDLCGRVTTATTSVTVQPYNALTVSIAYAGSGYAASMERCIDLTVGSVAFEQVLEFVDGVASIELQLPVGSYECATADDDLHTLASQAPVLIQGTRYAVAFAGDAALRNGDLTDDNAIDVADWGIAVVTIGSSASVNTSCATTGYHVDFDGNGLVQTADGDFILSQFLVLGQADCGGGGGLRGGRDSISVASLAALVGSVAIEADLNGDAMVDRTDIDLWIEQNGAQ
jgi:hypothetical protein